MKRKITVTVFLLFLASVAVFMAFGAQIRAALSPRIRYAYPVSREEGGRYYCVLPASAVWQEQEREQGGGTFVWRVVRSEEFPEAAFVVNAVPVAVDHEADGMVWFDYGSGGLSQSDAAAVEWPGTLREGMCVRPER